MTHTLQSLQEAALPEATEVLVVNNGFVGANAKVPFSSDGSIGPVLDFDLKYFEIPNKGYSQGVNFGMEQAKGEFLCILTDVAVEPETFEVLLNYFATVPKVGIVAPRLRFIDGRIQDNYRVFPHWFDLLVKRTPLRRFFKRRMRKYLMWDKDPHVSEPVDWLTGAMQVLTRECWEAIGPSDERFFLFMSDVDLCQTAWEKGFEVHYVGETQGWHDEARLSGGGLMDVFRKKVVRIHIKDALKYYLKRR